MMAGFVALMAAACIEEENFIQVDSENFLAPVLNEFTPDVTVLTEADAAKKYATVNFTPADYCVAASVNYTLYASIAGTDFAKEKQVGMPVTSPKNEISVTVLDVNKVLVSLNCTPGTEVELDFRVKAEWMGEKTAVSGSTLYSNVVKAVATPYSMEKTYEPVWVIGDYCGRAHDKTLFLWNYKEDGKIYSGLIDFGKAGADGAIASAAKNGWKITGVAGWDDTCNWGLEKDMAASEEEPASLQLFNGGGSKDIKVYTKRFYGFTFNKSDLTLKKEVSFDKIGIIGLNGDWDNDIVMEYSKHKQRFYADVQVAAETEFKFRTDGKWDYNLGGDLEKLSSGGDNIKIAAGNYRIYLDMNNPDAYVATVSADAYGTEEGTPSTPAPEPEPEPDQPSGKTVNMYFIPTPEWMGENITFAAWAWAEGKDGAWYEMTATSTEGVYETAIPEECANIIFTSMNGESDWANKVNQTADLKVPTDGTNVYDLATGTWSEYVAADVTVYFRPSADWIGEGITFAAWIWATGGNGSWYDMTDADADGIYEVTFPSDLDNIIFASMTGANDWGNKVKQTSDLKVPTDGKNTYDAGTGAWEEFGKVTVYFKPAASWVGEGITFAAWIWATGGEGSWYDMTDADADGIYEVTFPIELENIIFASMKGANDWGNKQNQTADLENPADGKNAYNGNTNTWMTLDAALAPETPENPDAKVSRWSLIGAFNGWSSDLAMYDEGKYQVVRNQKLSGGLKFRQDGQWNYKDESGNEIQTNFGLDKGSFAADAVLACRLGGSDINVAEGTYDVYLEVAEDGQSAKAYFMTGGKTPEEAGEAEVVIPDYSNCQLELVGSGVAEQEGAVVETVWNWGNALIASNDGKPSKNEHTYVWGWDNVSLTGEGWKIRVLNAAESGGIASFDLGNDAVAKDVSTGVQESADGNIYVTAGNYDITVVVDAENDHKKVIIKAKAE